MDEHGASIYFGTKQMKLRGKEVTCLKTEMRDARFDKRQDKIPVYVMKNVVIYPGQEGKVTLKKKSTVEKGIKLMSRQSLKMRCSPVVKLLL